MIKMIIFNKINDVLILTLALEQVFLFQSAISKLRYSAHMLS